MRNLFVRSLRQAVVSAAVTSALCAAPLQPAALAASPPPTYYLAVDLGSVAGGAERMGCISSNGALVVNRPVTINGVPRILASKLSIYPKGITNFYLFYDATHDSLATGCGPNAEYVGQTYGTGAIWDIEWTAGPQLLPPSGSIVGGPEPLALNGARVVVGRTWDLYVETPRSWAARWFTGTTPGDPLITEQRLWEGVATAINESGQIAGTRVGPRALLLADPKSATPRELRPAADLPSWANDIDDSGRVVGGYADGNGRDRPFLWSPGGASGTYTLLVPAARNGTTLLHAHANAIATSGPMIVGQSHGPLSNNIPATPIATAWPQAGSPRDLNLQASFELGRPLNMTLTDAVGIDSAGNVLCDARDTAGNRRAVLLRPQAGGAWR